MKLNKIEVLNGTLGSNYGVGVYASVMDSDERYKIFSFLTGLIEDDNGGWDVYFRKDPFVEFINYTKNVDVVDVYAIIDVIVDYNSGYYEVLGESEDIDTWMSEMQSLVIYSFYEAYRNPDKYIDPEELK